MDKINNFFSEIPIYWINLNNSKDRYNNAIAQLKTYKYNTRIEAIDGTNEALFTEKYNVKYVNKRNFTTGFVACVCSHIKAIKKAYENNIEKVCIFEDDFNLELLDSYPHTLKDIINASPPDWELIQLFYITDLDVHLNHYIEKGLSVFSPKKSYWGTCYLINRIGMSKILNSVKTDGEIYFEFVSEILCPETFIYKKVNHYIINFPPVFYGGYKSTMEQYCTDMKKSDCLSYLNVAKKRLFETLAKIKSIK